jgi:hypothetical protein
MKWIVYLNGIVWDSVRAKDKETALKKGKKLVDRQFTVPANKSVVVQREVEVESENDFIGIDSTSIV